MKDKTADFNVTEYEKFIHVDSDRTFQKLLQAEFRGGTQVHLQLPERAINTFLPFGTTYLCEAGFSSYTSTKTTNSNSLRGGVDIRIQLFSIKPDIKEIHKNIKQCHSFLQ